MTRLRTLYAKHKDWLVVAAVLVAVVVGLSAAQEHDAAMAARAHHEAHR